MVENGERHTCWRQPNKRADDAAWVEPIDQDWNQHPSQARHTCLKIMVVATRWLGEGILCRLFEPSFVQSMICTLSHSHIYSSITGCFFFCENHSPPPIEENQVKGKISQGTSSALLLALVLLLSAVSVLLLTSWRPPWTLACPAQCCSSLRIRAW